MMQEQEVCETDGAEEKALKGCKKTEVGRKMGQEERGCEQDARGRSLRGKGGKRREAVSRMQEEGVCEEGEARGERLLAGCKRKEFARKGRQEERGCEQDARGRSLRGRGGKRREAVSRMQEEGVCLCRQASLASSPVPRILMTRPGRLAKTTRSEVWSSYNI